MNLLQRVVLCGTVAMMAGWLAAGPAAAHEGREIANGQYEVIVGFLDEPAFAGEKNAMIAEIHKPAAGGAEDAEGTPVEGLVSSLKAEVIYADQRMELQLRPLFGQPGSYVGYFFPMAEGDYSFRLFGEIEGNAVDEIFTAGPETFAQVEPRAPYEFPKATASLTTAAFPAAMGLMALTVGSLYLRRRRGRAAA